MLYSTTVTPQTSNQSSNKKSYQHTFVYNVPRNDKIAQEQAAIRDSPTDIDPLKVSDETIFPDLSFVDYVLFRVRFEIALGI